MIVKLDQNIDCTSLCRKIGKMIERFRKENSLDNKILSIKIVDVVVLEDENTKNIEDKTAS